MSTQMIGLLLKSGWETLWMVFIATVMALVVGIPLGMLMTATRSDNFWRHTVLHRIISVIVNALRSIPFIILLVAIIPVTRFIVGTSIGTDAAIVPLSIAAIPFFARLVDNALQAVPGGLIEAAKAMGASPFQILHRILLREARPVIVQGATLTAIALVGYSAMAGAIGGGGLGDLAIRYGYDRFDVGVMLITVVVLIVFVQLLQLFGDAIAKQLTHE